MAKVALNDLARFCGLKYNHFRMPLIRFTPTKNMKQEKFTLQPSHFHFISSCYPFIRKKISLTLGFAFHRHNQPFDIIARPHFLIPRLSGIVHSPGLDRDLENCNPLVSHRVFYNSFLSHLLSMHHWANP